MRKWLKKHDVRSPFQEPVELNSTFSFPCINQSATQVNLPHLFSPISRKISYMCFTESEVYTENGDTSTYQLTPFSGRWLHPSMLFRASQASPGSGFKWLFGPFLWGPSIFICVQEPPERQWPSCLKKFSTNEWLVPTKSKVPASSDKPYLFNPVWRCWCLIKLLASTARRRYVAWVSLKSSCSKTAKVCIRLKRANDSSYAAMTFCRNSQKIIERIETRRER